MTYHNLFVWKEAASELEAPLSSPCPLRLCLFWPLSLTASGFCGANASRLGGMQITVCIRCRNALNFMFLTWGETWRYSSCEINRERCDVSPHVPLEGKHPHVTCKDVSFSEIFVLLSLYFWGTKCLTIMSSYCILTLQPQYIPRLPSLALNSIHQDRLAESNSRMWAFRQSWPQFHWSRVGSACVLINSTNKPNTQHSVAEQAVWFWQQRKNSHTYLCWSLANACFYSCRYDFKNRSTKVFLH